MGYASHLAVKAYDSNLNPLVTERASESLGLYYAQLALNLVWMPLFFTAKKPKLALANIGVLTGLVFTMTAKMHDLNTNPSTTLLLAPYCAWLAYGKGVRGNRTDNSLVPERWHCVRELEPPPGEWS